MATPRGENVAAPPRWSLRERGCLGLVGAKSVQTLGAFFTPAEIAERLVDRLSVRSWEEATTFDPACGAGDLLLPVAKKLPIQETARPTLRAWNDRILGCDLSLEFVEAAQLRLILLAINRGALLDATPTVLMKLLTSLVVADGLAESEAYRMSSCIVMNPPYGRISSGSQSWREGMVTAAACIHGPSRAIVCPGNSNYRTSPKRCCALEPATDIGGNISGDSLINQSLQSIGQFSTHADVDVFIQHFTKRKVRTSTPLMPDPIARLTVGSHFSVSVGSVVPHRDPKEGAAFAFLHPKNAPLWGEIKRISETQKVQRTNIYATVRSSAPNVATRNDCHRASGHPCIGSSRRGGGESPLSTDSQRQNCRNVPYSYGRSA